MTPNGTAANHAWLSRGQVRILASVVAVAIASGGLWWYNESARKQQQAELAAAQNASLQDFFVGFSANGLIPIVRAGAHLVGSVYNASTGNWVDEASTCFPGLTVGPARPGVLPSVSLRNLEQGSAALGLAKLLTASASAKSIRSVQITFSDVTVQVVPERALRDAYSAQNCSNLKPIFDSVVSGEAAKTPVPAYLIIQAIYLAKRKLVVQLETEREAKEALESVTKSTPVKGSVEGQGSGHFNLVLENELPIPVAASPAFIPSTVGIKLSPDQKTPSEVVWMPFRLDLNPDAAQTFRAIVGPSLGAAKTP